MRHALITLLAVLLLASMAAAQTPQRFYPGERDLDAQWVPGTPTDAVSVTVYVNMFTLTNTSGSDVTCRIFDRQSPPKALFYDTIGGQGSGKSSHYVMAYRGRKMLGGISWSCTAANAVVGYIQYTTGRY